MCFLAFFRSKYNLNALSHDCAIGLINKVLEKGVNVAEVSDSHMIIKSPKQDLTSSP